MPFVNVKVKKTVKGVTSLINEVMGRDRTLTTIVIDEIESSS